MCIVNGSLEYVPRPKPLLAPPLLARPAGVVVALAHAQLVVLRSAALRLVPILALLTETNRASQSAKHKNESSFERSADTGFGRT